MQFTSHAIIIEYLAFINNPDFPCVAARAAAARQHITCLVTDSMACPKDDREILQFLYNFVQVYRSAKDLFHSAAIIFKGPQSMDEEIFDKLMWQRLQGVSNLDAANYNYDKRVDANPASPDFSFSIMEEAFFIIGMHPGSSRHARSFQYPTLTFNPHAQFEQLRVTNNYTKMQSIVRKRDMVYSGSVNPMLTDFGKVSEVHQYSGRQYDKDWSCPIKIHHGKT